MSNFGNKGFVWLDNKYLQESESFVILGITTKIRSFRNDLLISRICDNSKEVVEKNCSLRSLQESDIISRQNRQSSNLSTIKFKTERNPVPLIPYTMIKKPVKKAATPAWPIKEYDWQMD